MCALCFIPLLGSGLLQCRHLASWFSGAILACVLPPSFWTVCLVAGCRCLRLWFLFHGHLHGFGVELRLSGPDPVLLAVDSASFHFWTCLSHLSVLWASLGLLFGCSRSPRSSVGPWGRRGWLHGLLLLLAWSLFVSPVVTSLNAWDGIFVPSLLPVCFWL